MAVANPKPLFEKGDKVFCFFGPLPQKATVLNTEINEKNGVKYLIHYDGWHKR